MAERTESVSKQPAELQREVQRMLGRCLLRIQQYERQMKALLTYHNVAGPVARFEVVRAERTESLATKTLGHLVGELTGSFLAASNVETHTRPSDSSEASTGAWLGFKVQIGMSLEAYNVTVAQLVEVVALRNDLVHHLIERYDLWSDDGCRAARGHLEASYEQIDAAFLTLQHWVDSMREAAHESAAFMATPVWEDLLVHGIEPDGKVDWPRSTVVELLRTQPPATPDGWCNLRTAIAALGRQHPDEMPKRYGCASWRQVLHESGQFSVRRDRSDGEASPQTWYRAK